MPTVIKITQKPTFDLEDIHLINFDELNGIVYIQTDKVFHFDNVFGNLENRSRVLRTDKEESHYIEHVISASIDAGFCGYLVWKTKLTVQGIELLKNSDDYTQMSKYFRSAQQLHLLPSPAGNYYNGTNQTQLSPDIIFTL